MKLEIDLQRCARTGQCYYTHPELVRRGEDDHPEVLVPASSEEQREAAEDVVDLCPQMAIKLSEEES